MKTLLLKHERINTANRKEETVTLEIETFADGIEIEIEDEVNFRAVHIALDKSQAVELAEFLGAWVNRPGP